MRPRLPPYLHEASCERYPEDGGFPADLRAHALTLAAYGRGRRLRAEEHLAAAQADLDEVLDRLLARSDVDYVHVRDTAAGCYDCRVER